MKLLKRQKLIAIVGPTASGKTGLAYVLCACVNGSIISADSRQVYQYMDIGTGKVDTSEDYESLKRQREQALKKTVEDRVYVFNGVTHYMLDAVRPLEEYNVALFQRDANIIIKKINKNQTTTPILVGGTGLYVDAVVDNWEFPEGEPNKEIRRALEQRIIEHGIGVAWAELIEKDSACELFVQKENPRRVVRALEYILSTGKKFSENRGKGERLFDILKIGISLAREELYRKIDERVDRRIGMGMVEEVERLHSDHGLSFERLRNFGLEYRVISDYLMGVTKSKAEMIQRLKWDIHAFARRQLTWFRRDREIRWVQGYDEGLELIQNFLRLERERGA